MEIYKNYGKDVNCKYVKKVVHLTRILEPLTIKLTSPQ